MQGDFSKAALSARKSLELCESDIYGGSTGGNDAIDSSHADIAVFAPSYSHIGLIYPIAIEPILKDWY